jgi:tripartite-type tricarboxylate transporter receptor subunit TctC
MKPRALCTACVALLAVGSGARCDAAEDAAKFFAGKAVTLTVGYGAGGSYDTGSRLMARHLGKHIPGNPSIVVRNMPGAGGMVLSNYLYNTAPKDGTALGMSGRGIYLEALFENPAVKFDPVKFNWIGSYGRETSVLVVSKTAPFKTVEDIRNNEIILSASSPGADTYSYALILRMFVGAKVKIVTGFQSQPNAFLAMERGEVHGNAGATVGTLMAVRPQWLNEEGHATFIVQVATQRHPKFFKGVPLIMDFAKNDVDKQALQLALARQQIAYAFAAPPDVPADRVKALRDGFNEMVKDPAFLAEANRMNADVAPVTGEDVAKIMAEAYAMPKEVIARAKGVLTVSQKK